VKVHNPAGEALVNVFVRGSLPLPKDYDKPIAGLALRDGEKILPTQVAVLSTYPDSDAKHPVGRPEIVQLIARAPSLPANAFKEFDVVQLGRSSAGVDAAPKVGKELSAWLAAAAPVIVEATDEDTRRAYLYTGKTSRAIYNSFHDLWEHSGLEPLPFPTQSLFASAMAEMFNKAEKKEFMGPFSGQVSGLINEIKPAAQILEDEHAKGPFPAILHCYTGGPELAARALKLGLYVSFSVSTSKINMVRDTIASGEQISGVGFPVTSSYGNGKLTR